MEVFKRADGRSPWWQVDFIHPLTGKRIRTSLKCRGTKVEATWGGWFTCDSRGCCVALVSTGEVFTPGISSP